MIIGRVYKFNSGHYLPNVPDGHKCKRQHGHNYRMEVVVSGIPTDVGFLIDFWDLDAIVGHYVKKVDHFNLNDITGLSNPTAEHIAGWFHERLDRDIKCAIAGTLSTLSHGPTESGVPPQRINPSLVLSWVKIWEEDDCWAQYP